LSAPVGDFWCSAGIALAFTAGFATILRSEVAKRRERTR
jgi:hypothetical protein